ncbi:MAG: hypothetical protein HHJ09_09695 [Glaciimonas sp.]|nr:hypothetical protein [Glaciimonas sp.]
MINAYHKCTYYFETHVAADINSAEPPRRDRVNVGIGIVLSLLLHGVLVVGYWNHTLPSDRAVDNVRPELEVRLLRSLPSPPSADAPMPHLPKQAQTATRRPRPVATQLVATASTMRSEPAATSTAATAKPLDLNMHASVHAAIAQVDRERRRTPVGQLQAKPLNAPVSETTLGREIANTARPDCKGKIAVGLLAPLAILAMTMDGKDSGCKW